LHALTIRAEDGEALRVWRHGDAGPAIVFLHGWTSSHLEWSPFVHELEARFRIFRWNARAHGGEPPQTPAVATAARMARDLEALIDTCDLAGACFVGHSMGALTLWQYVRDFGSAKLGRLCFIDQSPKLMTDESWPLGIYGDFDAARAARFSAELREDFAEAVLRLIAHGLNDLSRQGYTANTAGWQRMRAALRALPAAALTACWEDLVHLDLRDAIPRIDRPSLLIYGGRSNFYRLETAQWIGERIPGAQLSVYADANHSPHMTDPQRFIAELSAFAAG
jgi:pimeloyl-ACP methyl ester carboxylesterase